MKKIILTAVLAALAAAPTVLADELTATPTESSVYINDDEYTLDAYNINGNNYFKLRDLAAALS